MWERDLTLWDVLLLFMRKPKHKGMREMTEGLERNPTCPSVHCFASSGSCPSSIAGFPDSQKHCQMDSALQGQQALFTFSMMKESCMLRENRRDFGCILLKQKLINAWKLLMSIALSAHVCKSQIQKFLPPPSCPRLRRTISCLAPMLPNMASSSLAFMSLDFLKVRLFMRSNAFFPCMVNTTWALYPWRRQGVGGQRAHSEEIIASTAHSKQSRLVAQKAKKKAKKSR